MYKYEDSLTTHSPSKNLMVKTQIISKLVEKSNIATS